MGQCGSLLGTRIQYVNTIVLRRMEKVSNDVGPDQRKCQRNKEKEKKESFEECSSTYVRTVHNIGTAEAADSHPFIL